MLDSILADRDMIVDIVKNGTMLIVARLLSGGKIGDNIWGVSIIYVLIGFLVFHILVKRLIPTNLIANKSIRNALKNVIRIGTMLFVSKLISREKIDENWLKSAAYILVGYAFYDIVTAKIVQTDGIASSQIKSTVQDTAQMITVAIISRLLERKSFTDKYWLGSVLFTIIGFTVYDVGVSNLI